VRRARSIAPALVVLLAQLCLASASADTVDHIVMAEMQRQHSPAVAVALVKNGRPLKVAGYGLANVELQAKVTPTTFFQTASMGKQFVAALVLLLVNDGKLKLDETLPTYLPNAPPAWHSMTIRQLLNHTSLASRCTPELQRRPGRSAAASQGLRSCLPLSSESISPRMSYCRRHSIRRSRACT
jgi:CubicO group peptidase (beta-lactamase class C family)